MERCGYSVRMACKAVNLERSTYYYQRKRNVETELLTGELHRLSSRYPRYGYEMMTMKLRQGGWRVSEERVRRLWQREGLRIPRKQHKRRRTSPSTTVRQRALYPNHIWSWDFLFDRTDDGRMLKILNIVDEHSRFNIRLEARRSFTSKEVIVSLGRAMIDYGIPGCIRSDNGSEFIAGRIKDWIAENGIGMMYIEPGSPWENAFVESHNNLFRDGCLNRELFYHQMEAQLIIDDWRWEYNHERPHGSLGGRTPASVYKEFLSPGLRPGENNNQTPGGGYYH